MSNTWNVYMTFMMSRKNVEGPTRGIVIARNCCHPLAPSTRAASYSSAEMPCSPAR